jgi:hypothetical protein
VIPATPLPPSSADSARATGTPPAQRFIAELLQVLDQTPTEDRSPDNRKVFRAAVRALGSNSRAWATFHKREAELGTLLCGYNPLRVVESPA